MSNIFINRNRSQGAYKCPILKQKFLTTDQNWGVRANLHKQGSDTFYQRSLRYRANPDLSPKHVGMSWSIVDACDAIKPNAQQMKEKYRVTETSLPLYKAYNQYESPGLSYEERLEQYPGPGQPVIHPSMKSNGFTQYQHSGGISNNNLKNEINDIAAKIIKAKEMKGTLMLNNGKPNGTSWKTSQLDLSLNAQNGGETGQRFYSKFPIYRPRGHKAPAVTDDIDAIWKKQISLTNNQGEAKEKANLNELYARANRSNKNADSFNIQNTQTQKGTLRQNSNHRQGKSLKFAGENTLFPSRERFNEDVTSVISENQNKSNTLRARNLSSINGPTAPMDARSGVSHKSKQTLTPSELQRFFKDKSAKIAEDATSRISQFSRANAIKAKQSNAQALNTFVSNNANAQAKGNDAATVASSAVEAMSVHESQAATEILQDEYHKLLAEYEGIVDENQQMEEQVEQLKNTGELPEEGNE